MQLTTPSIEEPQSSHNSDALLLAALNNRSFALLFSLYGFRSQKKWVRNTSLALFSIASLFWFLYRTGTKPTRIVYPCQRAAVDHVSLSVSALVPLSITPFLMKFRWSSVLSAAGRAKTFVSKHWKPIAALLIIIPSVTIGGALLWQGLQPGLPPDGNGPIPDAILTLNASTATVFPASDIFVLNGQSVAHMSNLVDLMGSQGLYFYQSSTSGATQGPSGLIAQDDVVIVKINSQWNQRGGTNTDLLREIIQAIVNHPDGFTGEIVVADNGQGLGSMNYEENNADDQSQSTQDVVGEFSRIHDVSTYDWQLIRGNRVDDYHDGDMTDGYIVYGSPDSDTGIFVSYPKFTTTYGTRISFRNGIWTGSTYENRIKVINVPVLKSHMRYGVTAALKHYMGVQSEELNGGLANGHYSVATGGMGTLMVELGLPTLNIIDAIWVNANPYPSLDCGPATYYRDATRVDVLAASTDPVALDYWAAKQVLIQTAQLEGYGDTHSLDPDNTIVDSGLTEAFGVWFNHTKHELLRGGYAVTSDPNRMNVYVSQNLTTPSATAVIAYNPSLLFSRDHIVRKAIHIPFRRTA